MTERRGGEAGGVLMPFGLGGRRTWLLVLLVGLLAAGGGGWLWYARQPAVRKARYLTRAERYFGQEKFREAVIEYQNVLRVDPTNLQAIRQLGLAHFQLGELGPAFRYLRAVEQRDPGHLAVRVKLGRVYLLGNRLDEARREAAFVLEREPQNVEALLLLAGTPLTPQDVEATIRRLEAGRPHLERQARIDIALAQLYLNKRDVPTAERLLTEAVAQEPTSIEAHLALGTLYVGTSEMAQAEREFRTAAELAPPGSPARVRLADFYLLGRRVDEAKRILGEVTTQAPASLSAWRRLAEIALVEGKLDDADTALKPVLTKNPEDLDGHLLQGRIFLARGNPTRAVQEFQEVLKREPRLATAHYQLALAHLLEGRVHQAETELKEAIAAAPNHVEARLRLAQVHLETGAIDIAIGDLGRLVTAQPQLVEGYVLLGTAHLMKKEPAKALEVYRTLAATVPKDPRGPYLVGVGLLATRKVDEARKSFEDALALASGYVEPLVQLTRFDIAEKKPEVAVARVQRQIAAVPTSAPLHHLLGRTLEARHESTEAETAYLRAIELDPRLPGPYLELARLYGAGGRYDEAVTRTEQVLQANPRNLGALMLAGILHERKGDPARAEATYARVLDVNPRFAPAANNLAYLLAERSAEMERALQLAQTAREVAPDDPRIADTLGWILYKRGVYQRAVSLLKEGTVKLPDNPVIQYHLGIAATKLGDRETARKALASAVSSPQAFPGKDEARRLLGELR